MADAAAAAANLNYGKEIPKVVEQAKELLDAAGSLISRTSREEDSIRQRASSLDSQIRRFRDSIRSGNFDSVQAEKVRLHACIFLCISLLHVCTCLLLFFTFSLLHFAFQWDEELIKASYILSEGDAAAFLPTKSHGARLFVIIIITPYYFATLLKFLCV